MDRLGRWAPGVDGQLRILVLIPALLIPAQWELPRVPLVARVLVLVQWVLVQWVLVQWVVPVVR